MSPSTDHDWLKTRRSSHQAAWAVFVSVSIVLVLAPPSSAAASGTSDQDLMDRVSGERIVTTVTHLQDFGSRAYFSNSTWNASIYIHDRFAELGLWVTYQDFQVLGHPQRNVIAVLNGTDPTEPQYLFGAHYDSITMDLLDSDGGDDAVAPGADDDASGVAATIELATVLHDQEFNSTVKFVAFAAEETGLNGSFVFVQKEFDDGVEYADTVIMDMIGYRGSDRNKAFIFRDTAENSFAESTQNGIYSYGLNLSLTFLSGTDYGYSDHYPFWAVGYPSIMVIEDLIGGAPSNPYYHTVNDTVDHLSEEQMTVITKALLAGFLSLQETAEEETASSIPILALAVIVVMAVAIITSLYLITRRKAVE